MTKKILLIFAMIFSGTMMHAEFNGNGYYRVQNNHTKRIAYLLDDYAKVNLSASTVTLTAIELWLGLDRAVSDPATVLYISQVGQQYDIKAQGSSVHQMTDTYLNLAYRASNNAYLAWGTYGGLSKYLTDDTRSLTAERAWMSDSRNGDYSFWLINPISADSDNYFGIMPTLTAGGKNYAPMYCDFPFEPINPAMKICYVTKVDTQYGIAVYKTIESGKVAAAVPMFIECAGSTPAQNKVNVGVANATKPATNLLRGVYFNINNKYHAHKNQTPYNAKTMRVLGVTKAGKIGYVTSNEEYIARNSSYLTVSENAPAELTLMTEAEYEQYLWEHRTIEAEKVTLSQTSVEILLGGTAKLTATVSPDNTTDKTVAWSSANSAVATVDQQGNIKAVAVGTTTITARCGSVSASATIVVKPILAEKVTLSQTSVEVFIGGTAKLTATVSPDNTTDKTVTWSSANSAVATVDQQGNIKAVAVGTTTITARCGSVSASATIVVKPILAEKVTLSETNKEVFINEIFKITATISPDNTTDKAVTWTSADSAIATVDAGGNVRAVGLGSTVITATCGSVSAQCAVTVNPILAQSITLSATKIELFPGNHYELSAKVLPENTTDKTLVWSTSDAAIADVNQQGHVAALSIGTATITVACGAVTAECQVEVKPIPATGITLNATTIALYLGDTFTFQAKVSPDNASDKTVSWTSVDPEIVEIAEDGTATAVGLGKTMVTATCGKVTAMCEVTVNPIPAEGLTINVIELELYLEDTFKFIATVINENATDKTIVWSTSDADVLTISEDGEGVAIGVGVATVTATCGDVAATCEVKVKPIFASQVTINKSAIVLTEGEQTTLIATVSPDNTTDKTVVWTSSDETVATVDAEGRVTAVSVGVATITAVCGEVYGTCEVTVNPVYADEVTLDKTTIELTEGEQTTLIATVSPDNTTDKTVVWTSSDETVAMVDAEGTVTAVSVGVATITAACGEVYGTCEVTVNPIYADEVTLDKTTIELTEGEQTTLTATVSPDNTTDKTVVWTSSDETVATVDAEGTVTAVSAGTATITAACGEAYATCEITVIEYDGIIDVTTDEETYYYDLRGIYVGKECPQGGAYISVSRSGSKVIYRR